MGERLVPDPIQCLGFPNVVHILWFRHFLHKQDVRFDIILCLNREMDYKTNIANLITNAAAYKLYVCSLHKHIPIKCVIFMGYHRTHEQFF